MQKWLKFSAVIACLVVTAGIASADNVDNMGIGQIDRPEGVPGFALITEYTDYATWLAAITCVPAENRYAELGNGVIVTNQYNGVGATYTDGNDVTYAYGSSTDGMILDGVGRINISFSVPVCVIGVNFPGALRIVGYSGMTVVFTSSDFAGSGTGFFGGVISDTPFDRVELIDWVDDFVYIDDVFYCCDGGTGTEESSWGSVKNLFR
ncbi:MAG: hypothetical protein ABIK65_02915 [Candidatus Eisenbacteria bacterium]